MHVIARCAVHFGFWFVKVPVWGFLPWDVCASYHTYRTNLKCHLRHKSGQRLVEMDGCNWRLKRSHWRRSDLGTCIYFQILKHQFSLSKQLEVCWGRFIVFCLGPFHRKVKSLPKFAKYIPLFFHISIGAQVSLITYSTWEDLMNEH